MLLETPVIGDAVRLFDSPDVSNETRAKLDKLKKKTPTGTEHMWPLLLKRFHQALDKVAERQNEGRQNANK